MDLNELVHLFDGQLDAVVWYDPIFNDSGDEVVDFQVNYCNQTAANVLKTTRENILGKRILNNSYLSAEANKVIFKQLLDAYNSAKPIEYNYYNPQLDKHFSAVRNRVLNGIISITRDLTEEVQAAEKLKQHAALLKSIFNASINAIMILEKVVNATGEIINFKVMQINKAFIEIMGKPETEVLGQGYLELFPNQRHTFELNKEVLITGVALREEVFTQTEGDGIWYDVLMTKLDEDRLVVTFSDITAEKLSKKNLSDAAEQLQFITDTVQNAISLYSPVYNSDQEIVDFKIKFANKAARFYIDAKSDIVGAQISEFSPNYQEDKSFSMYKEVVETGQQQHAEIYYNRHLSHHWFDTLVTKQGDDILVTVHDVSRLKNLQFEIEDSLHELHLSNNVQQHLAQLNLYKDEFLSIASHELKTPLTSIKAYTQLLSKSVKNDDSLKFIHKSLYQVYRLERLISDLLDVSKINTGNLQFKFEKFNVKEAVLETLLDVDNLKCAHVINLKNNPDIDIQGDRLRLEQVMYNLVSNGIKYSPDANKIDVDCVIEDTELTFSVQDYGIGINKEECDRIFERFYRIEDSNKFGGLGLGLYISKSIIQAHGGSISIQSEINKGSRVCFKIPIN
jgi:signal transduction histidine kinase